MKKEVLEKILSSPKDVTRNDINMLINYPILNERINSSDLKKLFLSIYDFNNTSELGQADVGILGWLNKRSNKKRNKKFFKRLKKDLNHKKIYVEGDSWFQHPLIRDLIDNIDKQARKQDLLYAIYCSAMGGEWWINVIEDGDYLPEISLIKPSVILLSGGGNDIVGGKKVSNLVNPGKGYFKSVFENISASELSNTIDSHPYLNQVLNVKDDVLTKEQKQALIYGLTVISKEFYSLMWTFELMYKYVIKKIRIKFPEIKIITQGYDFSIPSYKKGPSPIKFLINWFTKNGHWLADALNLAGVEPDKQKDVILTLIYFFNELLVSIAEDSNFGKNLFHIDSRGVSDGDIRNWYDEMHVKPKIFKKIAKTYIDCIEKESPDRSVFKVGD